MPGVLPHPKQRRGGKKKEKARKPCPCTGKPKKGEEGLKKTLARRRECEEGKKKGGREMGIGMLYIYSSTGAAWAEVGEQGVGNAMGNCTAKGM